jgi:putative hemolysin
MGLLVVLPLLVVAACPKPGASDPPELPNPALEYCEAQGGTIEIAATPTGEQALCVLPDGVRCEAEAFLRGACPCGECPMWAPPAPGFCEGGTILPGAIDACGCQGPPVCERPPEATAGQPMTSVQSVRLESLYLDDRVRMADDALPARSISLLLSGSATAPLRGTLLIDPNMCTLDAFGDRQSCTRIGVRGVEVALQRSRLEDPQGLGRRHYEVIGEGLPRELALVVQGELTEGALERCYLVLGRELVPLYLDDGAW